MSDGPIILIRLGEPVPEARTRVGDYALWFQRAFDSPLGVVDLRRDDEELPEDAAGVIIMGSPVAVYDPHPWMPRAIAFARELLESGKPTLGVCFGHQLFCVARGGEVAWNPRGVEIGTVEVELNDEVVGDPLFAGLGSTLRVNASHDDTIVRLPEGVTVLGTSERDSHQVLRWAPNVWSVQFHPEMRQVETRLAITWRAPRLVDEGRDPEAVRDGVEEAEAGLGLLRNFAAIVRG